MTTIPRHVIVQQYLRAGTAEQIAYALNYFYISRDLAARKITKADVERVWSEELETNLVLRQLGERPVHGFDPNDGKVALADRLMVAA